MDVKTIDTYNQMAGEYDAETAGFWNLFPRTVLDTFANMVQGRVLDVGSGPGRDGLLLKEKGLHVTCLDASRAMVDLSRSRGLDSVQGDFLKLPFPERTFGGVWSYTTLLHVPKKDMQTALSEVARVLLPGGVFGLGMIEGDTEGYRENPGVTLPRWFSYYTEEELRNLLAESGFGVAYFDRFRPKTKNYLHFISTKK